MSRHRSPRSSQTSLLALWIAFVQRHAAWVVVLSVLAGLGATKYAVSTLRIDTDRDAMLDAALPFRQEQARLDAEFPQFKDRLVLVLEGAVPEDVRARALEVADRLRRESELFRSVTVPRADPFLESRGLLYQSLDDLEALAERLAEVQPFLGRLSSDPSFASFCELFAEAYVEKAQGTTEFDLSSVAHDAAVALEAALAGRPIRLSWQELLAGEDADEPDPERGRQYVLAQVAQDFGALFPAGPALAFVRDLRDELGLSAAVDSRAGLEPGRVSLRVTGGVAMGHEELESVQEGGALIGALALGMVLLLLFLGLASWRLVVAALAALGVGLAGTAAFAAVAVGHLNLISVAFAALYLGLGVDYAIHLALRYREALGETAGPEAAWRRTVDDVGIALLLCALTTSLGFFAFVPTAYAGVGELGIIAGTGMGISFVATLTVVPAILTLLPIAAASQPRPASEGPSTAEDEFAARPPGRAARSAVWALASVATVASLLALPGVRFDRNPLNLRDPKSESVSTFRDLLATSATPPWSLNVLVAPGEAEHELAEHLGALESVSRVVHLGSFVPAHQEEKLFVLDELAWTLGSVLTLATPPARSLAQNLAAAAELRAGVSTWLASLAQAGAPDDPDAQRLDRAVAQLEETARGPDQVSGQGSDQVSGLVARVEDAWLGTLAPNLERLSANLAAQPFGVRDLPAELVAQWVSASGLARLEVFPAADLDDEGAARHFVAEVRTLAPRATGAPVSILASGDAIASAFRRAMGIAIAATAIVLWALLRRWHDVALVLVPLVLAGLWTAGILTGLGIPFNFANVIGLPLLLGIGVDSGVHIVHRARHSGEVVDPLRTSTARAVVFSSATTFCSFASLSISPHRGTASMGQMLAIGIVCTLFATLVLLPAMLPRPAEPSGVT